jgi:drug/metabolite transporter (DMT)-like permease
MPRSRYLAGDGALRAKATPHGGKQGRRALAADHGPGARQRRRGSNGMSQRPGFGGDSPLRAILYMSAAGLLFPLLNASVKYLGGRYPILEIFWARYAGHVVFCLIAVLPRHGLSVFVSRRPGMQAWRSLLLFGASAFYFLGVQIIPLPTAAAISFVGPIIVTALSVPMLGERVGPRRWSAVLVGFVGAVVIIRPDASSVQWGAVLVLLDALLYAVYQILARKVGSLDPAAVSITLAGIGGFVISSLLLPFSPIVMPEDAIDWLVFALVGIWGLLGHFFVIKAYQWGSASLVAPLCYVELIGATLLGYVLFADLPDRFVWLGAAIIIASGLYITYREQRLRRMRP